MTKKKVKINTATAEELQRTLDGIGSTIAGDIVRYRDGEAGDGEAGENEKRYFHGPEDLARVDRITRAKAKRLKLDIDWRLPHKSSTIDFCLDLCHYLQQTRIWRYGKWLHGYGWPVVIAVIAVLAVLSAMVTVAGVQGLQGLIHSFFPKDPIRIDYEDNEQRGEFDGVIEDFDPNTSLGYYNDNDLIAYSSPVTNIDVVSQVGDEWIKLAPYLVVAITEIEPLPETVDYVVRPGKGGGGSVDFFVATLSPERDEIIGAPQVGALQTDASALQTDASKAASQQEPSDYFYLQPGEREVFTLTIGTVPGYRYHYRVGVPYSYNGTESVKWIDRKFVAALPTEDKKEWIINPNGGVVESSPQRPKVEAIQEQQSNKTDQIKREEEAIQKYQTFFSLPQSGPDG